MEDIIEVPLGLDLVTKLNKSSYDRIMACIMQGTSIRRIKSRNRYYCEFTKYPGLKVLVHRFLMNHKGYNVVDHINGDSLDNRLENLRIISFSENMMNRKKKFDSKLNLHHISIRKSTNLYRVRIVKDGIEYSKSGFKTIEEAIEYHKELITKLYPNSYKSIIKTNGYAEN